jgi:hypothetical protein
VALRVPPILAAGDYTLGLWVGTAYEDLLFEEVLRFTLEPAPDDRMDRTGTHRLVRPVIEWTAATADGVG